MATPFVISTDKSDYSKYDSSCSVVTVRGAVDAGHQGQTCTVTINRNDAYGTVSTQTIPNVSASFTATFDLNSSVMNDADGINRVVQGDYTAKATLPDASTATCPFTVSIVSVHEMRRSWLYGLTTLSSEIVLPKQQPRLMPVTFVEVSPAYVKDAYELVYTPSTGNVPATLQFAGGNAVELSAYTGIQDVILTDQRGSDWVHIQVDTYQLPATAQTELIVLDQAQLTDADFINQARLATAWVESKLGFYVEPRLVVSHKLKSKYPNFERESDGATFYDDFNPTLGHFPNISLPLQWCLAIHDLEGWYNQQKVLNVPSVWIQNGPQHQGDIELVPTSGQASALTWESFPFAFSAMQTRLVPDFWQFSVTAGLPDLIGDRAIIKEAIAKKAGIELALFAATAYRAGISSRSTTRDNISFSESYTASAMYSTFAHLTIPWQEWLKDNMPVIRRKIGGLPIVTMM